MLTIILHYRSDVNSEYGVYLRAALAYCEEQYYMESGYEWAWEPSND